MLLVLLREFTLVLLMACGTNIFKPALILLQILSLATAPLFFDFLFYSFSFHSLFLVLVLLSELVLLRFAFINEFVCFLLGHSPSDVIRLTHENVTQGSVFIFLLLLL